MSDERTPEEALDDLVLSSEALDSVWGGDREVTAGNAATVREALSRLFTQDELLHIHLALYAYDPPYPPESMAVIRKVNDQMVDY
jgi:hypothetical protein